MLQKLKSLYAVNGRLNRLAYWMIVLLIWALSVVILGAGMLLRTDALQVIILVGILVFFSISLCATIRRLHDLGRSAWWLLPFAILPALAKEASQYFLDQNAIGPGMGLTLIGGIMGIWGFVEIGCLKGTNGPNRYGADPLGPPDGDAGAFN